MTYEIRIILKDVGRGDVNSVHDEIEQKYFEDFDGPKGDFQIRIFEVQGDSRFEIDREEE